MSQVKVTLSSRMSNSNIQPSQMFLSLKTSLSKLTTTKSLLSLEHQAVARHRWYLCSNDSMIQQMVKFSTMEKISTSSILNGITRARLQLYPKSQFFSLKQSRTIFYMVLIPLNFQKKRSMRDQILHANRHIVQHSQKIKTNSLKVLKQWLEIRV